MPTLLELVGVQVTGRGQKQRPLQGVLQFPHVARPRMGEEPAPGLLRQRRDRQAVLAGKLFQDGVRNEQHVVPALSE